MFQVHILPHDLLLTVQPGENLLTLLRREGLAPNAPCGGAGTCGKCRVMIDGKYVRACQVSVQSDLTVTLPVPNSLFMLTPESGITRPSGPVAAAVDIGTTSVVCTLVDNHGENIAAKAAPNPQASYGADVVTRIRCALSGEMEKLTSIIRECVSSLLSACFDEASILPDEVKAICVVGNPAMQQLFLGISPENLIQIPFSPVLTKSSLQPCGQILTRYQDTPLLTVPDISGYVGADTIGCILAENLHKAQLPTLLVDIGTNGEMALACNGRIITCATAAGPALEGANIRFGMTASPGAIDHVWLEEGKIHVSTIENMAPIGICGSGLIDAVAVLLDLNILNQRGRIQWETENDGDRVFWLTETVYLTQEDIRQLQLAKGAIRAGIELMVSSAGITMEDISQCLLAGAFGTYLNPESACRIGLLPPKLSGRIRAVGNGALKGAGILAQNPQLLQTADWLAGNATYLELASLSEFPKTFAKAMRF